MASSLDTEFKCAKDAPTPDRSEQNNKTNITTTKKQRKANDPTMPNTPNPTQATKKMSATGRPASPAPPGASPPRAAAAAPAWVTTRAPTLVVTPAAAHAVPGSSPGSALTPIDRKSGAATRPPPPPQRRAKSKHRPPRAGVKRKVGFPSASPEASAVCWTPVLPILVARSWHSRAADHGVGAAMHNRTGEFPGSWRKCNRRTLKRRKHTADEPDAAARTLFPRPAGHHNDFDSDSDPDDE